VVGDRAFFDGMRRYYAGHAHGVATTADFRAAMEQASGRGLDWFFTQWVLQPGFPRFRVTSRWDSAARAAEIVVEQTQRVSWPTFRLPLTLEIRTEAGTTRRVIEVDERREVVRMPAAAPLLAVTLDPDGWVLKEVETKGGT
jgi:aminopeptidase N